MRLSVTTSKRPLTNVCVCLSQAMVEQECVGAIVCKLDMHKKMFRRGYIAMLAVDSKHRRKSIGELETSSCDAQKLLKKKKKKPCPFWSSGVIFVLSLTTKSLLCKCSILDKLHTELMCNTVTLCTARHFFYHQMPRQKNNSSFSF